uniref:DUF6589 domain-containing protein n=1 Tax=Amphimedon queenslandica TaxID=400682 RepID=A0A1X7UGT4_AMPQE
MQYVIALIFQEHLKILIRFLIHKELCELPVTDLLPTASDDISLLCNLSVLIGRILVKEFPYFTRSFDCATTDHITHTYYDEMVVKSMTEQLGIILKKENVLEDIIEILLHLNEYVPCHTQTALDCVTQLEVTADAIHEILLGADQLTRKRVESAKEDRKNDVSLLTRLKGFIPVTKNWHAKKIFLEIS